MLKNKKEKWYITIGFSILLVLLVFFMFSGDNFDILKSLFDKNLTTDELRDRMMGFGVRGYITIVILSMLQVVCAFFPAEPTQVIAGIVFGFPVGLACCILGVVIGNSLIYLLYKTYGDRIGQYFVKNLEFDLEKAANSSRSVFIIFILYFLPAIPYGMICFFAASIGMKYRRFITVTVLGSIPSVCIGVALGHMTLATSWIISVSVFAVLVALIIAISVKRDWFFAKVNEYALKPPYSSKTAVRKCNYFLFGFLYFVLRFYYRLCGIRIKTVNKCGDKLQGPCVVLCNHGSFIDFIYAAKLLRKYKPNFVSARLYFYHKWLGTVLKMLGCFPKSMFATDLESTKNCIKVLKDGGVLAMMPEARLSTAGRFEDIQETTYSFLKKSNVPIYTIKINGDYLAKPKWSKDVRRGALVEAELDILLTEKQIEESSVEQIKRKVEEKLYYNEFEWLEARPDLKYHSKKMAEGLENILTTCPKCNRKFTITAKGKEIFCEHCGKLTEIDQRYSFTPDFNFNNLLQWYDWQQQGLKAEIIDNDNFALVSEVELRLPSDDGKTLTRKAGNGVCTLTRDGLQYKGSRDGKDFEVDFSIERIYRLLFGAGENFEIYNGSEIFYFVPKERRSAVEWYMASMILYDEIVGGK
ncbi:MAG: VTT domain-containing protein [Clostridia bacterium]|nr:VTT domain-containing protein [Clostridia bacterium]